MNCTRTIRVGVHSTQVLLGGAVQRTLVLDDRTVAQINQARGQTIVQPNNTAVTVTEQPTRVMLGTSMGPQGPKGEPGGTIPTIGFSYGDAPGVVWTPDTGGVLTYARIKITTAFDAPGATIMVGTLSDPEAALPAGYVWPQAAEEYENTPDVRLIAGQSIRIHIDPAGATAGAGLLFLAFTPD